MGSLCAQCHREPAVGILYQEVSADTLKQAAEVSENLSVPPGIKKMIESITPNGFQRMGAYYQEHLDFFSSQVPEGVKFRVEPIANDPIERQG